MIEHKRYSSVEEYARGLRETNLPQTEIEELIVHERAHFERAKQLRYTPLYALSTYTIENPLNVLILFNGVIFSEKNPTDRHMIKILLAPRDPSEDDLYVSRRLKRELKRETRRLKKLKRNSA
ncbi:MAG: hypothetical protein AABX54_04630 [Nanoarchaeota archaeon]